MKKITAMVLAMLMLIGMVGNAVAAYEEGGIAAIVGSAFVLSVDVEADGLAKASETKNYSTDDVTVYYSSNGREFDYKAVIDLANVKTKFDAGKLLAKKAFEARVPADVEAYMAAFDELSVTGSFEIVVNYDSALVLPEMTAEMLSADETLFTWDAPVDNGEGQVTLTVNVADGVQAKDIETKLFKSKLTFTCEGVEAAEIGTYEVSGSMTGVTYIKEGDATIAEISYTTVQDAGDEDGNLAISVSVAKRKVNITTDDDDTTSKPVKEPEATIEGDVVTVPAELASEEITVPYKAEENTVLDTIVVLDSEGNVIETKYNDEEGTITFEADGKGKYTVFSATEIEVMILTIDEYDAHVFGEEDTNDVVPKIVNDRTMLPARFVAENLGANVEWDEEARKVTITKDEIKIEITIDSEIAVVNGEEVKLDSPAFIENSRTYTPIRFISENLGARVFWNGETQKVTIVR